MKICQIVKTVEILEYEISYCCKKAGKWSYCEDDHFGLRLTKRDGVKGHITISFCPFCGKKTQLVTEEVN